MTEENVQSRLRGLLLMAVSNKFGPLVLTTGNKSELAVGYCTLYGDMCGGLAPISDLPKMRVYALARHLNARAGRRAHPRGDAREGAVGRAPAGPDRPGLAPAVPAPRRDPRGRSSSGTSRSRPRRARAEAPLALVTEIARQLDRAEYKRGQAAPGLKVSAKAFGSGRRIPIAQRSPALKYAAAPDAPRYPWKEIPGSSHVVLLSKILARGTGLAVLDLGFGAGAARAAHPAGVPVPRRHRARPRGGAARAHRSSTTP